MQFVCFFKFIFINFFFLPPVNTLGHTFSNFFSFFFTFVFFIVYPTEQGGLLYYRTMKVVFTSTCVLDARHTEGCTNVIIIISSLFLFYIFSTPKESIVVRWNDIYVCNVTDVDDVTESGRKKFWKKSLLKGKIHIYVKARSFSRWGRWHARQNVRHTITCASCVIQSKEPCLFFSLSYLLPLIVKKLLSLYTLTCIFLKRNLPKQK